MIVYGNPPYAAMTKEMLQSRLDDYIKEQPEGQIILPEDLFYACLFHLCTHRGQCITYQGRRFYCEQ